MADRQAALEWFEAERVNLLAAVRQAGRDDQYADPRFAVRMVAELYPFLPMRGYYRDWLEVSRTALAAARQTDSPGDEAVALTHLGGAYQRTGNVAGSLDCLRTALALRQQLGDPHAVALAFDHLGMALANAGELAEAKRCFHRSLALHRGNGASGAVASASASRPELGSSRIMRSGWSRTKARASATRCHWPPDSTMPVSGLFLSRC